MIYLKFCGTQSNAAPIDQRVICTRSYSVARDDIGIRVFDEQGQWERVSKRDWLNCFVMSETGKTIDKIEA